MENEYRKEIAQLIAKAWSDQAFKEKLLKNPKEAFSEFGIPCPEDVKIYVHENKEGEWHFVLPREPEAEISEEELKDVAGGTICFSSGSSKSGLSD